MRLEQCLHVLHQRVCNIVFSFPFGSVGEFAKNVSHFVHINFFRHVIKYWYLYK